MSNLPLVSNAIRFLSVDAVQLANSGHPGMPMGMADIATVLYEKHLKFGKNHLLLFYITGKVPGLSYVSCPY